MPARTSCAPPLSDSASNPRPQLGQCVGIVRRRSANARTPHRLQRRMGMRPLAGTRFMIAEPAPAGSLPDQLVGLAFAPGHPAPLAPLTPASRRR
jgi:hypothetical protein